MSELGPEARALIAAGRKSGDPTLEDRERVRAKLGAVLGGVGAGSELARAQAAHDASAPAALPSGPAALLPSLKIALAAVAGAALAAGLWADASRPRRPARERVTQAAPPKPVARAATEPPPPVRAEPPPPRVRPRARTEPPALPARSSATSGPKESVGPGVDPPDAPAAPVETSEAEPVPPVARPAEPVAAVPEVSADHDVPATATPRPQPPSLAGELALLDRAQRALRRGQRERALELLEAHALRFPRGALAQERLAAQVLALCELGRREQAARALRALARHAPESPWLARLRAGCRASPR